MKRISIGFLTPTHHPGLLKQACFDQASINNADFFIFTRKDILLKEKKIRARLFENRELKERLVDFPDVIIDRFRGRGNTTKYKKLYESLQGIPLTNSSSTKTLNKLDLYLQMEQLNLLRNNRISFRQINSVDNIMLFIQKEKDIILKPKESFGGSYIYRITIEKDNYIVKANDSYKEMNEESLYTFLLSKIEEREYVIQKYIESIDRDGRPFDIRVHLMKDNVGEWSVVKVYARLGNIGAVVSNLASGGHIERFTTFWSRQFPKEDKSNITNAEEEIGRLALNFLSELRPILPIGVTDIGLDLGITQDKKVYLFEVNTYLPEATFHEYAVAEHLVGYALFLARKNLV